METTHMKRREQFFTNLLLLGLDPKQMEKKYRIVFNKDMFTVPNKKGFEIVTYFLFSKLSEVTQEEYKIFWPLLDKKQEHEFRKTCFTYLTKIAQDDSGVRFPRIFQTLFMSPGGDRFYEVYLAFSCYIMQKFILKDGMCRMLSEPTLTPHNHQDVKEILKLSTIISTREFTNVQKVSLQYHQKWQETAEQFTIYYRKTKQNIVEKQKLLKEKINSLYSSFCQDAENQPLSEDSKFQDIVQKSDTELERMQKIWKTLEIYVDKEKEYWDIIKTELDAESTEKFSLNGKKYMFEIPETLTTVCKKELQERKVQTIQENGKVSIKNLLNLWIVCLEHYSHIFEQVCLPKAGNLASTLKENIQRLSEYLNIITSLSQKFTSEILPEVVTRTKNLEVAAYSEEIVSNLEARSVKFPPKTPTLTFTPISRRSSSVLPEGGLALTPPTGRDLYSSRRQRLTNRPISPLIFEPVCDSQTCESNQDGTHMTNRLERRISFGKSKEKQLTKISFLPSPTLKAKQDMSSRTADFTLYSESDGFFDNNTNVGSSARDFNSHSQNIQSFVGESNYIFSESFSISRREPCDINKNSNKAVIERLADRNANREKNRIEKVKTKLVHEIVSRLTDQSPEEFSPVFNTTSSEPCNSDDSFDFLGQKAFTTREKLPRSPGETDFGMDITDKLANLSIHLRSRDNSLCGDDLLNLSTYGRNSWGEEEMLDSVTLPSVPMF